MSSQEKVRKVMKNVIESIGTTPLFDWLFISLLIFEIYAKFPSFLFIHPSVMYGAFFNLTRKGDLHNVSFIPKSW